MENNNYTIAVVVLQEDYCKKEYRFKCFDKTVKNGDNVICNARNKYCIATVLKIQSQEECDVTVTKDIVCKFDDSEYKQRVIEREAIAIRNKELKEISKELDLRLRKTRDSVYYSGIAKEFAEKDPELATLAKKYIELANME